MTSREPGGNAARIDLDALERLAEEATQKPHGRSSPFVAACDPVTVLALVRAVRAALLLHPSPVLPLATSAHHLALLQALAVFRNAERAA